VKVLTVVGTRPQLIKEAAVQPVLRAAHEEIFVDTGQHYDRDMAAVFYEELSLSPADYLLDTGGGGHSEQTGRMLIQLEPIIRTVGPDLCLVYGDTNSTLAGALAAAKAGIPVAHVEAGLRSMDRYMPEEINRVVVDRLSTWLFAPTTTAADNLRAEGITAGVHVVGDVLQDLCSRVAGSVRDPQALAMVEACAGAPPSASPLRPGHYLFATIHRAENRVPENAARCAAVLNRLATPERPVVLAIHPGTRLAFEREGVQLSQSVLVVQPLPYRASLAAQLHAAAVLTDSGGVQREASWLRTPCLVLRERTEWPELVDTATKTTMIVGLEADAAARALAMLAGPERASRPALERPPVEPSGAVDRIVAVLADRATLAGPPRAA
jgi:UDP-GlcNAc3NAcA epimerase